MMARRVEFRVTVCLLVRPYIHTFLGPQGVLALQMGGIGRFPRPQNAINPKPRKYHD